MTKRNSNKPHFNRILEIAPLLKKKSFFLFGPRSTGKTTLIEDQLENIHLYDLLEDDTYLRLMKSPQIIEQENLADPKLIVIDEIQKLPKILDEVHRLIKKHNWKFLLTGSSARKVKKGAANLLGGRAWEAHLFPLVYQEINNFDLLQYINRGGLPHVYPSEDFKEELKAYVNIYLREEIVSEGLVKKYEYFLNFLDVMAISNGEELNFETLASDSGVPARTILNYVQILEDTLLGYQVPSFKKTKKRKATTKAKFYLFDIGVTNFLAHRGFIEKSSELFGKAFEHFIMNEIRAYLSYTRKDLSLCYWRTQDQKEVDCLIGNEVAIEIKSTKNIGPTHLKGLEALQEEKIFKSYFIVSQELKPRKLESGIQILPWEFFLKQLWSGKII